MESFEFFTNLPGYPFGILVAVGSRKSKIRQLLRKRSGCSADTCLSNWAWVQDGDDVPFEKGHSALLPCNRSVLWLRSDRLGSDEIATIAHEAFHVVYAVIGDRAKIPLTEQTEEAYAYPIGNLVRIVVDGIRKRRKSVRRAVARRN